MPQSKQVFDFEAAVRALQDGQEKPWSVCSPLLALLFGEVLGAGRRQNDLCAAGLVSRAVSRDAGGARNWRIIGGGQAVLWRDLDEGIGVEGLLAGRPSRESQASFRKWLEQRRRS